MGGGNVEKTQLVCARRIIGLRLFDWVAGIPEIDEIDALDHAAIGDIETRDDADADGHAKRLTPAPPSGSPPPGRAAPRKAPGR